MVIVDIMTATYTVSFQILHSFVLPLKILLKMTFFKLVELFSGHLGYKKPKVAFSIVVARIP